MVLPSTVENANEKSASLSFVSSYPTRWSTNQSTGPEICSDLDNLNFKRRRSNPEEALHDAEIVVDGKSVAVNRSKLSACNQTFHRVFNLRKDKFMCEGKPKYLMTDLVPRGKVGYEAFNDILHYLYTGKLKASPPEVSTCVDHACDHGACPPAINYAIELMYACDAFQLAGLVSVFQRRLLNFVEKALVEDVIPILVAAFHCELNELHSHCIQRVVRSDLDNVCLEKELPDEVSKDIKSLRVKSNQKSEGNTAEVDPMHEKRVRRIHKALDHGDFGLLNLFLKEYKVTLEDAYALHYAAAYCNLKVFKEVLNMGSFDLNCKDARGRTVLHVAARRKEPAVLVTLLSKGACASETTSDGQTAVAICRRMTRRKDFTEATKHGQETNKDRICIDVLERELRRKSMSGNLALSSEVMADDFQIRLNFVEKRVAIAQSLFPSETRIAMDMAGAKLEEVDLNETPSMQTRGLHLRLQALLKTFEMGRRYFPQCFELIETIVDCGWSDALHLKFGTLEEQEPKKACFMEPKEDVQMAFYRDKASDNRSGLPSSSSASYRYMAENNRSGMLTSSVSSN